MKIDEKIRQIRKAMRKNGVAAIVVPSDDPHKSEYVAEHWQARKWLTGFSGSAGTAVLTQKHAILWTDSRYYIQAENQIADSEFVLFKMGEPEVPGVEKWLAENLAPEETVGVDGKVFSVSGIKKLAKELKKKKITLAPDTDLIGGLWTDRPARPSSASYLYPEKYAGESRAGKLSRIREKMAGQSADFHLVSTLDDIAWILNLRGSDVHTNPVNAAFLLIGPEQTDLFMEEAKADADVITALRADGVNLSGYDAVEGSLSGLPAGASIMIDSENINCFLHQAINKECRIIEGPNPAIALKAVKNETQIRHLEDTAVKDGVAVVNFFFKLEHLDADEEMTEQSAAEELFALRKGQPHFVDNSFDPIVAWKDHSAIVHYNADDESDVPIRGDGMLLVDSGGNYLTGTTDITRTLWMGLPPQEAKVDYTLVLKGHIAVAKSLFPKGTKGFQIDTLARQHLWNQGVNFGHGTGHGVGFFLCVHEGPARISPHPSGAKLESGMLLTNEPGLYREGLYGIRLENMILVDAALENEFGAFLRFRNMTWCHFEKDLMETGMMTSEEILWINNYHQKVYEKLGGQLESSVADWLREKTAPV